MNEQSKTAALLTKAGLKALKPDEAYWYGFADGFKDGKWVGVYEQWTLCREQLPPDDETVWVTAKKKNGQRYTQKAFIDGTLKVWVGEDGNGMSTLQITDSVISWMKYYPDPMIEVLG